MEEEGESARERIEAIDPSVRGVDAECVEPPDLLGDGAIERGVAGMNSGDVVALGMGGLDLGDDLFQIHRRGIQHARAVGRGGDHLFRYQ